MATIQVQNLVKRFEQQTVLQDLSLKIPDGSFFTLLGPSGCGKTTLLRTIAGFNQPDSGSIWFDDDEISQLAAHKRNIGMVFQDYALFPDKSVFDNVAYGLKARKVPHQELVQRVDEALHQVGLKDFKARYPAQLSGGQRQRVALARALVIRPRVLLMDEPLSNLDAKLRHTMRDVILDLQRSLKITTIFVTHDQEEALAMSDYIAIMQHGQIAQLGTPTELYDTPASSYVADFVGSANLLPVEVIDANTASFKGTTLSASCGRLAPGSKGLMVLRAENLAIGTERTIAGNVLPARMIRSLYLGPKNSYRVQLDLQHELRVETSTHQRFSEGQNVYVSFPNAGQVVAL